MFEIGCTGPGGNQVLGSACILTYCQLYGYLIITLSLVISFNFLFFRTRGAGGVAELEKLLSNAVVQLHEFCKKSVTFSGTVSLEGTLTLRTDVAATVLIKTHTQDGLKGKILL